MRRSPHSVAHRNRPGALDCLRNQAISLKWQRWVGVGTGPGGEKRHSFFHKVLLKQEL